LVIGGGSPIDCAKAVALLSTNGEGDIRPYEGIDKITRPLPPMVMAPSTAGTGADVSQFCIITDTERRLKMVLASKSLVPDISITDPLLLTTKDRELTAHTGMDALTHAIEAYLSVAATPLTDVHALNAIRLISRNLRESVASRTNLRAKEAMAMASLQAGLAFSNAVLGAVHAMAHQLGGMLDMPHGEVDAILLPYVMEFNFIAATERYVDIAVAMGQEVAGLNRREAGLRAITAVRALACDIGIPGSLAEIGVKPEDISQLSANAMKDACLVTNPRDTTMADIEALFRRAWAGGG
jgi:1,3-propanediol dehydrogenase